MAWANWLAPIDAACILDAIPWEAPKKTQEMLGSLKKGDRVVTSGGIYGTVQGVEADVVYLKIAENVKVKVARSAITGIQPGESASE